MTFIKTAVGCLIIPAGILFCLSAQAQTPSRKDIISLDRMFASKPQPVSRWILSLNPYGLLEPPAAIGLGVGYRLTERVELWSETSFITNGFFQTEGPVTGVRQILQTKYFVDRNLNFFVFLQLKRNGRSSSCISRRRILLVSRIADLYPTSVSIKKSAGVTGIVTRAGVLILSTVLRIASTKMPVARSSSSN